MFSIIDVPPDGPAEESHDAERVRPPPKGTVRWVDLVDTDPASLRLLGERFAFHPLSLEDCARFETRSKIEDFGGYLFVVVHTFTAPDGDVCDFQTHEVHAFVSDDSLVTVHDNPVPAEQSVWQRALADPEILRRGPARALYHTANAMVEAIFPLLDRVLEQVEAVEVAVLERPKKADFQRIFRIKRSLVSMRRVIRPLRDSLSILSRSEDPRIDARTALYFRDLHDHVVLAHEIIEEGLDLASNAMEAYRSAVSGRTNEVIKSLTVMSAIFLPLSFIVGFWGQNFAALPFDSATHFAWMLVMIVAVPIGLFVWFQMKGWLTDG